jgi:hypothetical protein
MTFATKHVISIIAFIIALMVLYFYFNQRAVVWSICHHNEKSTTSTFNIHDGMVKNTKIAISV